MVSNLHSRKCLKLILNLVRTLKNYRLSFTEIKLVVGGRVLVYGLQIIGGLNVNNNSTLKKNLEQLALDVESNTNCNQWEKLQVKALRYLSTNNPDAAIRQWEEILIEFPSDILSLHLAGMTCLINGRLGWYNKSFHFDFHLLFTPYFIVHT